MSHPNPRYAGLRPHPEKLGVTPLREGESSRPLRVRAEDWVFERLKSMSSAQLGELITSALLAADQSNQQALTPTPNLVLSASSPLPLALQEPVKIKRAKKASTAEDSELLAVKLPKLSGRPLQLLERLKEPGAAVEMKGGICMLTVDNKPKQTFDQGTGRHLLNMPEVLIPAGPDRWILSPRLIT